MPRNNHNGATRAVADLLKAKGLVTRAWGSAEEDLSGTDRVIVIAPGGVNQNRRTLVTGTSGTNFSSLPAPIDPNQTNIVYGIDNGPLVRLFNRAEYYIATRRARCLRVARRTRESS